jgi:hypothetical protein
VTGLEIFLFYTLYKKSRLYIDTVDELITLLNNPPVDSATQDANQNDPNAAPIANPVILPANRNLTPAGEYREVVRLMHYSRYHASIGVETSYSFVQLTNVIIMLLWAAKRYALFLILFWSLIKIGVFYYISLQKAKKENESIKVKKMLYAMLLMSIVIFFAMIAGLSEVFEDYPKDCEKTCYGIQGYIEAFAVNLVAFILGIDIFYLYYVIKAEEKHESLAQLKNQIVTQLPYELENIPILAPGLHQLNAKVDGLVTFIGLLNKRLGGLSILHAMLSIICVISFMG